MIRGTTTTKRIGKQLRIITFVLHYIDIEFKIKKILTDVEVTNVGGLGYRIELRLQHPWEQQ